MNTKNLLNQLMKHGGELIGNKSSERSSSGSDNSSSHSSSKKAVNKVKGLFNSVGGAAATGSSLKFLLGNKKRMMMGGKVLAYGGLAALGVMAYKAYSNYQQKQQTANPHSPQTIDRVPEPQTEAHRFAILRAIIAAAKADGHIDVRERQLIQDEFAKGGTDATSSQWLEEELAKPLDPSDVASAASTPEIASEMYLASVLAVDSENDKERKYLQELARHLKLEPELQTELDQQAQAALSEQTAS